MTAAFPHRRRGNAFTLVELLVAMSILSMLLLILLSIVDHTTKLWQASENRVDSFREARAALNIIAADLRSSYISKDPERFRRNVKDGLPNTAVSDAGNLFFLSAQPADSQDETPAENSTEAGNKSDLCSVGYFLAFDASALRGAKSMNLYRYFRSSTDTMEKIHGDKPLFSDIETGPGGAEVLARNVTGFKVRAFAIDKTSGKPVELAGSDATPPDYIDLELSAVNNDTAKKLPENKGAWQDGNNIVLKQAKRTFALRVNMPPAHADASPTPTPPTP